MDAVLLSETIDEILNHVRTSSSKSNIEELQKTLETIQQLVKGLHLQGGEALALLRKLNNAIYDVTDLLEELSTDYALPQKSKLSFIKTADPLNDRLKAVNAKIKNVIEVLQRIAVELRVTATNTPTPTPTPTQEAREEMQETELDLSVIGREKEKKEIIHQLMPPRRNIGASDVVPNVVASDVVPIPVVTIVGFAGIGKKELVRLICKDNVVQAHFGRPIRVGDVESFEKCVVATSLTNKKHYLVVMEDLTTEISEEDLMKLQVILKGGESAILITTRSKFVANNITDNIHSNNNIATSFTYVLKELNEEGSWSLFWRIHGPSSIIGEIEQKIVMDCGGVPLLIKFTSEFLNSRSGDTAANDASLQEEFLKKLKFKYYDKLTRLHKMCFSFCSLFPRDHLIDVKRLNHLLNAEGFLMDVKSTTVEENLSQYFNDFLQKPFFKDIEEDKCGVVRKCRMQPLMHDLACFVSDQAANIKVDPEGGKVHEGVLRASFYFSLNISRGIPSSLFEIAKNLRVILLWKTQTLLPDEVKMTTSACDKIFKTFKRTLRILDLHEMGIKQLPASVGNMSNLKYLDLSFNTMVKLPGSITKLSNLQTLKLSQCYLLKELPKDIDKLTNLNHLEIEGCLALTHMPKEIRKMGGSLQTLTLFVVSNKYLSGGLLDLGCLFNLRGHLEIFHLERNLPKNNCYLVDKKHLQHLTLRWDHKDDEEHNSDKDLETLESLEPHYKLRTIFLEGYKGITLSTWFSSINCLVKLSLYDCTNCKFLPQLKHLPKLKFLELLRLENLQYITENDSVKDKQDAMLLLFFPSLKELNISDCPNLMGWWRNTKIDDKFPSFSCLSKLHVCYCPKLIWMPLFAGLDEELVLVGSSVKPLINSIVDSKTRYNPFSKLKYMKISSIKESGSPPEKWIKYFNSLEKLDIKDWRDLKSFPKGFGNLTSLRSLNIENCQELDLDLSYNEWRGLKNLRSLTIRENPKLESLPSGVINLTSLQNLQLHNCPEMTSLPEKICKLQSLGRLVIYECNKLASLPKSLKKMKSLHTLIILDCTLLLPRCQPDTGDDWPQIAHIENKKVAKTHRGI